MAKDIPPGATLKDLSAQFNQFTIPLRLRTFSPLEPEMWGKVVVSEGEVDLFLGGVAKPLRVTPAVPGIIPADTPFRLERTGKPVRFQIHYFHEARLTDGKELATLLAGRPAERRGAS
jgi:hypothetical protein